MINQAIGALTYDVRHVAGVAPKPVKPGDHNLVANAQRLNDGFKLAASLAARTRHFLQPNYIAAFDAQTVDLPGQILIGC